MIDPAEQAELDQVHANLGELLSSLWWAIYHRCIDVGFSEEQAMELLVLYIKSQPIGEDDD